MNSYKSPINISHDHVTIKYPEWNGSADKYVSAPVPSVQEFKYEPHVVRRWKIKPKNETPFSIVKRKRLIKMTDYSVGEHQIYNHLVKFKHRSWNVAFGGAISCPNTFGYGPRLLISQWDKVQDGRAFINENVRPFYYLDDVDSMISDDLNDVKANCISDSFSGFDLLTNLAEFPDALEMIVTALKNARHPLKGIKELMDKYKKARSRGKTRREAHDEIASQWMQYRYGIMPLVLSIKDALELLDKSAEEFHTSRSWNTLTLNENSHPLVPEDKYYFQKLQGTFTVSAVGKARYESKGLRLSDLITFNPFLTAWELIPLSFVIDWFVNVGDVIFSHTSTLSDLAVERKFCASVKKVYTLDTCYRTSYTDSFKESRTGFPSSAYECAAKDSLRAPYSFDESFDVKLDCTLITNQYETYDRNVFTPTDVSLRFNPSLSWMRMLDGYVLSLKPILKALKSIQ